MFSRVFQNFLFLRYLFFEWFVKVIEAVRVKN